MDLSRRGFAGGMLAFAAAGPLGGAAVAQPRPGPTAALDAIRAYAEAHMRRFGLPGLTMSLIAPGGFSTVLNFGYADPGARRPIAADTLFQIGSITKVMTAAVIHQLAAAGRLRLDDRVAAHVPQIPLPPGNAVTIQHLLDHRSGVPNMTPTFVEGGLWLGFTPGTQWHYSNTGYDILGKVAEQVGGKPLAQLFAERLFRPLEMPRSRGAIVGPDRPRFAQGFEPADPTAPWVPGVPLAPAPWIDVTFGAGSVASTADDMTRFLRSLTDAAQGRGGLGLAPEQAAALVRRTVPSDTPGMRYGNGLMHVANAGRSYLHHTGGMLGFTSSFHLDVASGVAAFASSTLGSLDYRPRLLTRFAADALANALAGRAPPAPPPLDIALANAASYIGRYSGPAGAFEVRAGSPLTVFADGQSAPLIPAGGEAFRTPHPRLRAFTLLFERKPTGVTGSGWGSHSFVRAGGGGALPASDPALAKLAGRYVSDNPWFGALIVVERGGKLWVGTDRPLTRLGDNLWRLGERSWSPERVSFADFVGERPQTLIYSGVRFPRHDV